MKKLILLSFAIVAFAIGVAAQNISLKEGLYYEQGKLYTGTYSELTAAGIKKSTITIANGKIKGAVTYYYDNGNVMETGSFVDNEKTGQWLRYDESGKKTAEAYYVSGKKDGTWMIWDMNGIKRTEMHYAKGEKIGKWMQWDESGNLTSEKVYTTL